MAEKGAWMVSASGSWSVHPPFIHSQLKKPKIFGSGKISWAFLKILWQFFLDKNNWLNKQTTSRLICVCSCNQLQLLCASWLKRGIFSFIRGHLNFGIVNYHAFSTPVIIFFWTGSNFASTQIQSMIRCSTILKY